MNDLAKNILIAIVVIVIIALVIFLIWWFMPKATSPPTTDSNMFLANPGLAVIPAAATATALPFTVPKPTDLSIDTKEVIEGASPFINSGNDYLAKANPKNATWNPDQYLPKQGTRGLDGNAPTLEELTAGREAVYNPQQFLKAAGARSYFYEPLTVRPKNMGTDQRPLPSIGKAADCCFYGSDGITKTELNAYNRGACSFYGSTC